MFLRKKHFATDNKLSFPSKSVLEFQEFEEKWTERLKSGCSVVLSSKVRKVVEDEDFWKQVGTLIAATKELEYIE